VWFNFDEGRGSKRRGAKRRGAKSLKNPLFAFLQIGGIWRGEKGR
jgi:hypothetical protein